MVKNPFYPGISFFLFLLMFTCVKAVTVTFSGTELLGKPTDQSITINIVPDDDIEYYYEYGTTQGEPYTFQTTTVSASGGEPHEVTITGLSADTRYYYRMVYDGDGDVNDGDFEVRSEYTFHTQRAAGDTYVFTIISDSHLNNSLGSNTTLYNQACINVEADNPDFHLDLGDTFFMDAASTGGKVTTDALAEERYLSQRPYMGNFSHSAAVYISPGNHEQEEGWNFDDTPTSEAILGLRARKKYWPNPTPDGFYTGNNDLFPDTPPPTYADNIGDNQFREDYYAWEWGDALFIVFDPFQYTMENPYGNFAGEGSDDPASGDRWNWTLGQEQFNWLKSTLENSNAKYKFMFAHNMVGGTQNYVRGGAEPAHQFEWGGYNADGVTWGFSSERPGWGDDPIRQLMIDNNVTAFFHGHDHQYAYEVRDDIVYQSMPAPSMSGNGFNLYSESDPYTIKVLPNSGHLRVTITPAEATVEYVRSELGGGLNGQVSHTYTMEPYISGPTISLSESLTAFSSEPGSPSDEQSYTVSGSDLTDDITINAPTDFEISTSSGSGFGSQIVLSESAGSVSSTTIYVRFNRATAGTSNGDITHTSSGASQQDIAVSGTAALPSPTISITGSLTNFNSEPGLPSSEQSYTVSGSNLTDDITIEAPTDFQISTTSGSGFGSQIVLPESAGSVFATTVYVRFNRGTEGTTNGNITHTSSGASQQDVAVSGTAAEPGSITYIGDIGSATIKDSGNDVLTIITSTAVTAGDDIFIAYATDPSQNLQINVTDDAGNFYNEIALSINVGQLRTYLFASYNVSAMTSGSSINITQSNGTPTARAAVASVFRGADGIDLLDQTSTADDDNSSTPSSGTTSTTIQSDELLIGVVGTEGPEGDATGTWLNSFTDCPRSGTSGESDDTNITVALGYRIVSSTGTYSAQKSGITARDWSAAIATFRTEPVTYQEMVSDYDDSDGFEAVISHTDGDNITATGTGGTITSIHVYRVDSDPLQSATITQPGAVASPYRYWGVRIYGSGTPTYTIIYNYDGHPGISNEADLDIMTRTGPADDTWDLTSSSLDDIANTLTLTGQTGTEYALASVTEDNSLPVSLSSFSAIQVNNGVELNWTTESQLDNAGFELWRAQGQSESFVKIVSYETDENLAGAGNNSQHLEYTFLDQSVEAGNRYTYKLSDVDYSGIQTFHKTVSLDINRFNPHQYALYPNWPNPFNPETKIRFFVPQDKAGNKLNIRVYNISGQLVKTLYSSSISAGEHQLKWNALNDKNVRLPSGIYLLELSSKNFRKVRKMVLLK